MYFASFWNEVLKGLILDGKILPTIMETFERK